MGRESRYNMGKRETKRAGTPGGKDGRMEHINVKEFWDQTEGQELFEKKMKRPDCIILDSEYCSMGRMIAGKACEGTSYTYYDAALLLELLPEVREEKAAILEYDAVLAGWEKTAEELAEDPEFQRISGIYQRAVQKALELGPCLIHERGIKEKVEAMGYSCLSAIAYGTVQESKRGRAKATPDYGMLETEEELDQAIAAEDRKRRLYHDALSSSPWGAKETYDLCINTEILGKEAGVRLLRFLMTEGK